MKNHFPFQMMDTMFLPKMMDTMYERFEQTVCKRRSPRIEARQYEADTSRNTKTETSRNNENEESASRDDSENETVISGLALSEARRRTREAQQKRKLEMSSIHDNLEAKSQTPKTGDVIDEESECDDFLRKKTTGLKDLTNCQRKRSFLHQVENYFVTKVKHLVSLD